MNEIISDSYFQAVAQNHFYYGNKYYYQIVEGKIQYKTSSSDWQSIANPRAGIEVKRIAADNNRLFVLTSDNKLYWRCMVEDAASWVIFMFILCEVAGQGVLDNLVWLLIGDDFTIDGVRYPDFASYAKAYRELTLISHDTRWNLLDKGVPGDDIVDIAVGNWNNSVVTYYVLLKSGKIHYTDEEPIISGWFEVKGKNRPILDENSMICASHSVIAATKGNKIHWIRIDAHNPDTSPFFSDINFSEVWFDLPGYKQANHPGWHSIDSPASEIAEFFIDVGCGVPWPIPGIDRSNPFTSTLYRFIKIFSEAIDEYRNTHTECGAFGYIDPSESRYNYPMCCVIKQRNNKKYNHIFIPAPRSVTENFQSAVWESVEVNPCLGYVGNIKTKELHTPLCRRGSKMYQQNRKLYDTLENAFAGGYDGCFYCLREYSER